MMNLPGLVEPRDKNTFIGKVVCQGNDLVLPVQEEDAVNSYVDCRFCGRCLLGGAAFVLEKMSEEVCVMQPLV